MKQNIKIFAFLALTMFMSYIISSPISGFAEESAQNSVQDNTATTENNEKSPEISDEKVEEHMEAKPQEVVEQDTATEEKVEAQDEQLSQKDKLIVLQLESGAVLIELYPEYAPKHVARIRELTKEGFYDGVAFHRVIEGFMAQTGDPTGTGTGGSGQNIPAEFNDLKHERGIVSMARASNPNSADSQFFIMFEDAPHLDGNYSAFGRVIHGMDKIDAIKKGFGPSGMVSEPDKIVSMYIVSQKPVTELPLEILSYIEGGNSEKANHDDAAKAE